MKNKLLNNIGLKVMALLFAAILWMIAAGINNPMGTQVFYNVQVQLTNTGSITSQDKTYKVEDSSDRIRVTVRAPRTVLEELSKENISAVADCTGLTEENTVPIVVSINDRYLSDSVESIQADKESVSLDVEDKKNRQLSIEVVRNGSLPAGYVTGRVETETNRISLSGPESVVNTVSRAVVEVSLDSVTSDVEIEAPIKLLDAEGSEITSSDIKKNIDSVRVTVPILSTKEVPVEYGVSGSPADGYAMTGAVSVEPATVLIAGRESALEGVSSIQIPGERLDVTDAEENVTETVNLRDYLPSGVSFGDSSFDGTVSVTVEIEAIRRKNISIQESSIQLLNTPADWQAEVVAGQNITLTISGLQRYLNLTDASSVTPHADVSTLLDTEGNPPAGEVEIAVRFMLPDTVQQVSPVTAVIRLTRRAQETAQAGA